MGLSPTSLPALLLCGTSRGDPAAKHPPGMELELWGKKTPWEEHPLALGGASLGESLSQPWGNPCPSPGGLHVPTLGESMSQPWGEHPWALGESMSQPWALGRAHLSLGESISLGKSIPWPQGEHP